LSTLGKLTISGTDLIVDISKPISESKFYITPVTKGGSISPKAIDILVCGNEVITLNNPTKVFVGLPKPVVGTLTYEASDYFTSS
jgi:hypothetical protein